MRPSCQLLRCVIIGFVVTIGAGALSDVAAQTRLTGTTMGPIIYNVTVVDDVEDQQQLHDEINQRLEQINRLMSTYIKDSEVSQINSAQADQWVTVDPLTLQVIDRALELSHLTNGAFDITVGPAVDAWKFGPDSGGLDSGTDASDVPSDDTSVGLRPLWVIKTSKPARNLQVFARSIRKHESICRRLQKVLRWIESPNCLRNESTRTSWSKLVAK